MKNFKKVLALVLVIATLFSFAAMASAKTIEDYSDGENVRYVEAVDVLSALGIINGYTDGTFKPEGTIDRDEMAKMVAVLRNAGDFDASLYASANKFADAKGSWAEGYIAYCAQVGIVAGRNASTYDPEGKVKGVEVLKMLLCTLGYDAEEQGYVGANWQVNVLRDAKKSDLLNGLAKMDIYEAATREQAAQMFLNALKANMVYGYLSENIVKLSNSLYLMDGTGSYDDFISLPDAQQKGYELAYCNAILSNVPLYNIFGGIIAMEGDMLDCFGRPATVWTIRNQYGATTLSKAYPATPDFEFTADVELDVELGGLYGFNNQPTSVTTYVNGAEEVYANTLVRASEYTGNGIKTEVFVDGDEIIVVIIETFIGQVAEITKLPATVTLTNGVTFSNTLGLQEDDFVMYHVCAGDDPFVTPDRDNGIVVPGNDADAIDAYDATGARVGYIHDVWQVYPTVETVIHASRGLNPVSWLDDSYFQTSGAKFEYAANFTDDLNLPGTAEDYVLGWGWVVPEENVYDVYVNEYGYVMYVEEHIDEPDYKYGYFVEDTQDANAGTIVNGVTVRAYAMDVVNYDGMAGTKTALVDQAMERVTWLDSMYGFDGINGGATPDNSDFGSTDYIGRLARYEINEFGEIEVTGGDEDWGVVTDGFVVKGVAEIYGTRGIVADRETQYMVRTWNWATQTYTYNVYVGYQNLPETLFGVKPVQSANDVIASMQYLVSNDPDDDPCVATHVFIDATYAGTYQTFYLLNPVSWDSETALYPWLSGYVVFEALIDGQKAYVAATNEDGTGFGNTTINVSNALYEAYMKVIDGVTINGLPLYLALAEMQPADWTLVNGPFNGLLTVANLVSNHLHMQIADEAPIHVVYHMYDKDYGFDTDEWSFKTFVGETRDADFKAFFSADDFQSMRIYVTTEDVTDDFFDFNDTQVITEMWIQLTEK